MASGMNTCLAFVRPWAQSLHCKIKTSGFFVLTGKWREMTFRDFGVHQTHGVLCFALLLCFEMFICVWMCSCVAMWRPEVNLWCHSWRTIQLFELVSLTGTWGLLIWLAWLFGGIFLSLHLHPQKYKVYMGAGDQTQVCHPLSLIFFLKESEALPVSYGCWLRDDVWGLL